MEKNKEIEHWVIQYLDYLLQYAIFKTQNRQVSEDLVQDTFISAHEAFDSFKGDASPKTWLLSILRNKVIDFKRREIRLHGKNEIGNNDIIDEEFDSFDNWKKENRPFNIWDTGTHLMDDPDFQKTLNNCLSDLLPNHEAVLKLKYLQGMKANEICQELEISTSNYWQLIHRAKLKLRKCLDLKWFTK
jgi:RNA polymerase sigma-70 factor (TIGR02943 family)